MRHETSFQNRLVDLGWRLWPFGDTVDRRLMQWEQDPHPSVSKQEDSNTFPSRLSYTLNPEIFSFVAQTVPIALQENKQLPWVRLMERLGMRDMYAEADDQFSAIRYSESTEEYSKRLHIHKDITRGIYRGTFDGQPLVMGIVMSQPYNDGDLFTAGYSCYSMRSKTDLQKNSLDILATRDRSRYDLIWTQQDLQYPDEPPIEFSGTFDREGKKL